MFITLSSIFPEVGYAFEIDYKSLKTLVSRLNEKLSPSKIFNEKYENYRLGIIVSTGSKVEHLYIKGPTISKRYKVVDFVIYIPFEMVQKSDNYVSTYLKYLQDGVIKVAKIYNFSSDEIEIIFDTIQREVN